LTNSQISGNTEIDAAYYVADSKLGITNSSLDGKYIRMNGFMELNYQFKNFSAGMRFEAYLPPLLGYDANYQGLGVPYWYVKYKNDLIEITAGNFYEQFGNGMTFRTYQDWTLGYDNSMKGLRAKFMPIDGITLTGVYGVQRTYWMPFNNNNRGIIKGFDADFCLNDMVKSLENSNFNMTFGGSFVSDYQKGKTMDITYNNQILELKLPENVASYGGRINLNVGGFNIYSEYAHKINDPSQMNQYIYKPGQVILVDLSYSRKGLGIEAKTKWLDNMSYKSDRSITISGLDINYLPPVTKEHTYFLASMYPYATQTLGEAGFSGEIVYTIPRKSKLGGKTGLTIDVNYSQVNSIKKSPVNDQTVIGQTGTLGYKTNFFSVGNILYYQDANIEVTKKFGKLFKGIFSYYHQAYNKDVIENHIDEYGTVYSDIGVIDFTWNINTKNSIRCEIQGLWTKQDKGNWAAGLLEYTIVPKWFFTISDQWNYGNEDPSQRIHYYNVGAAFTYNTTRIQLAYGRQRAGMLCVGGICRYVPQTSGLTLTITSSF
jgi:hypothetical protein